MALCKKAALFITWVQAYPTSPPFFLMPERILKRCYLGFAQSLVFTLVAERILPRLELRSSSPSSSLFWTEMVKKRSVRPRGVKLMTTKEKIWNASRICVSSLRRGHANLLCIVPILVYVLRE